MLDVSGADGAVTVTLKSNCRRATDFIRIDGPSSATVISDIKVGVTAHSPRKLPSEPEAQMLAERRPR